MRKSEVHIGGIYIAKISGIITKVQLVEEYYDRGWIATNLRTGRQVRIRSAGKLRKEVITVTQKENE